MILYTKEAKTTGDTKKALIFRANNFKTGSPDSSGDQCGQLSSSEDPFTTIAGSLVSETQHAALWKSRSSRSDHHGQAGITAINCVSHLQPVLWQFQKDNF